MGKAEDDALIQASSRGDVPALREALKKGAQLECKDTVRNGCATTYPALRY